MLQHLTLLVTLKAAAAQLRLSGLPGIMTKNKKTMVKKKLSSITIRRILQHGVSSHPCNRLQAATQRPLRLKLRQLTHRSDPGPQQPSSVHSGSQVRFCHSGGGTDTTKGSGWGSAHLDTSRRSGWDY